MVRVSSIQRRQGLRCRSASRVIGALLLGIAATSSYAFEVASENAARPVLQRSFVAPELGVTPAFDQTKRMLESASRPAVANFSKRTPGEWEMRWDRRSDRPNLVQGSGIPLIPGKGNQLDAGKMQLKGEMRKAGIDDIESLLLDFIADNHELLGVDGLEFGLDPNSSTAYGEGDTHWFVEFAQSSNGVPVRGAHLFFRISHGNIVQFGTEMVAPVSTDTTPTSTREAAFELAYQEMGMPASNALTFTQPGELLLLPYATDGAGSGDSYQGIDGAGYGHHLAWHFVFNYPGDPTTYDVLVDARTNRVLEVRDGNQYANATVDGGVLLGANTGPETVMPMPFVAVTNGTAKVTDALGIYSYGSGSANTRLDGKYFKMVDNCGAISLSASSGGNLHLGTDSGTDCGSTTAAGGAGNTRSSRNGFYYLTKINRKAATFLPNNAWIASKVTANMNINDACNAYWDGTSVNFFKSGTINGLKCANTGEIPAVFLHEWGHGMDTNSGGSAGEYGSGEAVGDTFAFLETKSACIGSGFFSDGRTCSYCGSSCTGVRDLNAFSTLGARTVAKPSTITADTGANCDAWACPYLKNGIFPYQGPMGYEGHCESYIASSANWDLAQKLVAQYGATAGYAQMDKIWYGSLTASKSAYRVVSGGKCNTAAVVNGCGSNNWYTVYLAADDDDGNLANGTPNACRIWDAFNAHGIACGTRPACTVGGGNAAPVAVIRYTTAVGSLTANFTDASTDSDGTIASRAWNFGDGTTSTETNPAHAYAAAGTYTVTLTVTDNLGATNTASSSVTVPKPANVAPTANFSASVNGLTATFADASSDSDGTITARYWNFGDNTSSTATNPSRTYAAAGTYTVTLTVADNLGATASKSQSVTVTNPVQTYSNGNSYSAGPGGTAKSPIVVSGRSGNAPASTPVTFFIDSFRVAASKVDLIAPDGSTYRLLDTVPAYGYYGTVYVNLSSEPLNGTWTLRLYNAGSQDTNKILSWSIKF